MLRQKSSQDFVAGEGAARWLCQKCIGSIHTNLRKNVTGGSRFPHQGELVMLRKSQEFLNNGGAPEKIVFQLMGRMRRFNYVFDMRVAAPASKDPIKQAIRSDKKASKTKGFKRTKRYVSNKRTREDEPQRKKQCFFRGGL